MKIRDVLLSPYSIPIFSLVLFAQKIGDLPLQPRFDSALLNYWGNALLFLCFPFSLFRLARYFEKRWAKTICYVIATVSILPCLIVAGGAVLSSPKLGDGIDYSFEQVSEAKLNEIVKYRLYRSDCGATCSYGLVLRKEYDFLIGIRLVSFLWSYYPAKDGWLEQDNSRVKVMSGGYAVHEISY